MRKSYSLFFWFVLLCLELNSQHISDFVSLADLGQDKNFNIPSTHDFQYLIQHEDPLTSGGTMPDVLDFAGFVPDQQNNKSGYLCINSESAPGGITILDIEFDDRIGKWQIDHAEAVNFPINPFLPSFTFATISNCSGAVTPWGTMISCEETTSIETSEFCIQYPTDEKCILFDERDNNGDGYDDFGWAMEIDPITKKVIDQPGGRTDKDKLWALGNFKHENAVVHNNLRTVYQGADDTNGEGYLFKFVADAKKKLSSGSLYVYKGNKIDTHSWIKLNNSTPAEQNSTLEQCANVGATSFGGIEDVEIDPVTKMIYFAVKRESNDLFSNLGVVYRFRDIDPLNGDGLDSFEIYAGGDISYNGVEWGNGTDNLAFDDQGNLWVAQDESGANRRNYIWLIENGHSQSNPKAKIFARTPLGSEPTGMTFTPDYKYMFLSIQHPNSTNATTSQTDAFGKSVAFDKDITMVLARKENFNQDQASADKSIMISQYFHDENNDSRWLEIKNISGRPIESNRYYLDLYDESKVHNIASESPTASDTIPALAVNEVVLFKNKEKPAVPENSHLGGSRQIVSAVCNFDGDDVILISSTPRNRKFNNRRDILGKIPLQEWGENKVLLRGAKGEQPEPEFTAQSWVETDSLNEVIYADSNTNIALGTHEMGTTRWDGSSWDKLTPDLSRKAEIANDYSIEDGAFKSFDLNVLSGATFNFSGDQPSNSSIVVYGDLKIQGQMILGDTESLLIKNPDAIVEGEIEKIEHSATRSHKNDITYWSSMVESASVEDVFVGVNPNRIFYYDQTKQTSEDPTDDGYWAGWVNASGTMSIGKGYAAEGIIESSGIHEVVFKGKPNHGRIILPDLIFNNDQGANENLNNDYNLVGNPYTASIDIDSFLKTNAMENQAIDGSVYFWSHSTPPDDSGFSQSDYITYNFVGGVGGGSTIDAHIGSGQGFFVRAVNASSLIFDPAMMLEDSNTQFFKEPEKKNSGISDRIWIEVAAAGGQKHQTLIGFTPNATKDFDNGYDALFLDNNYGVKLYSILDEKKFIIQSPGQFDKEHEIKLGVQTQIKDKEYSLKIARMEGEIGTVQIILVDHYLNKWHDLKLKPYLFNLEREGSYLDRFSLKFSTNALSLEEELEENFRLFFEGDQLIIQSEIKIIDTELYDYLGRSLHRSKHDSEKVSIDLSHVKRGSVFILRTIAEDGSSQVKKMIKP